MKCGLSSALLYFDRYILLVKLRNDAVFFTTVLIVWYNGVRIEVLNAVGCYR